MCGCLCCLVDTPLNLTTLWLQVQLQAFMEQFFENAKSVRRAIEFTQRFERSAYFVSQ